MGGGKAMGVQLPSARSLWTDPGVLMQVFTEADFAVGKQCNINGCDFLIYGNNSAQQLGTTTGARKSAAG